MSAGSKTGFHDADMLLDVLELDGRIDLEALIPSTLRSLPEDDERRLVVESRWARRVLAEFR